jgi:phasin family protein
MSKTTTPDSMNPFGSLDKLMEQFKVPGVDINSIVESRRKDMEALIAANQTAFAAMQQIAKKQTEILTQAFQSAQAGAQQLAQGVGGVVDPVKQADLARKAYEKALADMKELTEMAQKAQTTAMSGITARAQQSVQELTKLIQPK